MTLIACLLYGFKTLDTQSVTYFSDVLIDNLKFSTNQYTSLTSLYYLAYGLSSIILGLLIGKTHVRKVWLVPTMLLIGISSIFISTVDSYMGLVICRLISGLAGGCSLSLLLSIIAKNLVKEDYGTRSGVINAISAFIGNVLGPLFFAWMTHYYSWNSAFLISGFSLIFLSILTQFSIKEVQYPIMEKQNHGRALTESIHIMFTNKVFVLCLILGILETAANLSQGVFIPLYFSDIIGMDTVSKGWALSLKGFAFIPVCFIVPLLSDRFSIKTLLVATFVFAFIAPFSAYILKGTKISVYLLIIFGSWAEITVTLFAYVIPRLVLPEYLHAEANGIILGSAIVFGGCIAPVILSSLIDIGYSVVTVLGICSLLMFICIFISALIPLHSRNSRK